MVIHGQNLGFVRLLGILRYIFLIVQQQLPEQFQRSAKVTVVNVHLDHFRHTSDCHIVAKYIHIDIHLNLRERREAGHMSIEVFYLRLRIAPGPQELLKVQRMHLIILFVADCIGLDLFIVYAHQGTGTNDIIARIRIERFKGCGAVRAFLQLVKKNERLVWNKPP